MKVSSSRSTAHVRSILYIGLQLSGDRNPICACIGRNESVRVRVRSALARAISVPAVAGVHLMRCKLTPQEVVHVVHVFTDKVWSELPVFDALQQHSINGDEVKQFDHFLTVGVSYSAPVIWLTTACTFCSSHSVNLGHSHMYQLGHTNPATRCLCNAVCTYAGIQGEGYNR